ncbi:MAG: hypothetical protein KKF78_06725, partial [Candidatus Omnitrophica bacterium]|nr:hypothetical protein [Candidatus Omnitrophota bacterium]MBU1996832.1 hypothetical protein [Candidatus Omnitrophota bacterium]
LFKLVLKRIIMMSAGKNSYRDREDKETEDIIKEMDMMELREEIKLFKESGKNLSEAEREKKLLELNEKIQKLMFEE